jgi:hypothetical protein
LSAIEIALRQRQPERWGRPEFLPAITLYTAVADAISNMAHPVGNPQAENGGKWFSLPE